MNRVLTDRIKIAIIGDMAMGQKSTDKIYDDMDEKTLDALPVTALHRNVDIPLAKAHKEGVFKRVARASGLQSLSRNWTSGYIKAYVVAPPLIYGLTSGPLVDAGLQNPVATGLLIYSRCSQAKGSFGFVGPQENIWSVIDVHDCESRIRWN